MKKSSENYLEKKPMRNPIYRWTEDDGIITIEIDNKGIFNRIAQKLFKKPKVSYIHLDETGSFIWPKLNGERTLIELGELVEEKFGEKAHPLYERLAEYCRILESYNFIIFK